MLCPKCESKTKVYDSRSRSGTVHRYRKCLSCEHKFQTKEVLLEAQKTKPKPAAPPKRPPKRKLKPRPKHRPVTTYDIDSMTDDELLDALESGRVTADMLD